MKTRTIAIAVADLHLSLNPPLARAAEPNWLDAMSRPLKELRELAEKLNVPILCSGDVLDRWNSSAELINFAIEHLPWMHAIPGQHDLPLHSLVDIHKSAYWTLVKAGNIWHINGKQQDVAGFLGTVSAFPWGVPVEPLPPPVHLRNASNSPLSGIT